MAPQAVSGLKTQNAIRSIDLSFRAPLVHYPSSEDEVELSLPGDESDSSAITKTPSKTASRDLFLWSSERVLSIDDAVRQEAASQTLLAMKRNKSTRPVFHSKLAENLSNIFALANLRLEQETPDINPASMIAEEQLKTELDIKRKEFQMQAEASISRVLNDQKRERQEQAERERKTELERTERVKAELERARLLQEDLDNKAKAEQQKQAFLEQIQSIETDTSTLLPIGPLQDRDSLRRFCQNRAEMFRQTAALVKSAPFSPDKELFLQVNEVLNRFVPNQAAVAATVADLSAILSRAPSLDVHFCNMASSFIKQVQNKVFQSPDLAAGFSALWAQLNVVLPRSSVFIMAGFFAKCPPSSLILADPEVQLNIAQAGSLRALLRVFCSFLHRSDNACTVFTWNWLSAVCSSPPSKTIAPCLLMFLEVSQISEFSIFKFYGRQGRKLLKYIANSVLLSLPPPSGTLGSDIENLKTFFDLRTLRSSPDRSFVLACLER
uniref:mRNA export factor GLE1 n=1 Tax=Spongospora subterranea TaxID=70186 RepID=A0A0H5RB01_9EUKA|eukprot:CRZ11223.1 hypothetical protein [Spongospora subterranea]